MIAASIICALFSIPAHAEVASIYGGSDGYCNKPTASGERFNCSALTAAMRKGDARLGDHVRVCHGQRCVTVRINDRGPFVKGRKIDLSPAAARAIGCGGLCNVTLIKGSWGM